MGKELAVCEGAEHKIIFSQKVTIGDCTSCASHDISELPPAKRVRVTKSDDPVNGDLGHLRIGASVVGFWPEDETWLPATIIDIVDDGCKVEWTADGSESELPSEYVRAAHTMQEETFAIFSEGAEVEGYWPEDDTWLPATIIEVCPD